MILPPRLRFWVCMLALPRYKLSSPVDCSTHRSPMPLPHFTQDFLALLDKSSLVYFTGWLAGDYKRLNRRQGISFYNRSLRRHSSQVLRLAWVGRESIIVHLSGQRPSRLSHMPTTPLVLSPIALSSAWGAYSGRSLCSLHFILLVWYGIIDLLFIQISSGGRCCFCPCAVVG